MNRKWMWISAAVVMVHVVVYFVMWRDRPPVVSSPNPVDGPTFAGQAQTERVSDFVTQVASYKTFESCGEGLNDAIDADFDVVFDVGFQSQDMVPQMSFARVLADRRVSKLFAFLNEMSPDEAERQSAQLFDQKLKFHCSEMSFGLTEWAQAGKASRPINLYRNQHAALSALFLCSHFCRTEVTFQKVDTWEHDMRPILDSIQSNPKWAPLQWETHRYGCPQELYQMNLYCHILTHRGSLPMTEIPAAIGWAMIPESQLTSLCPWDALTNPFDFTHIHMGIEPDDQQSLVDVNLVRSWGNMDGQVETQTALLIKLRELIVSRNL